MSPTNCMASRRLVQPGEEIRSRYTLARTRSSASFRATWRAAPRIRRGSGRPARVARRPAVGAVRPGVPGRCGGGRLPPRETGQLHGAAAHAGADTLLLLRRGHARVSRVPGGVVQRRLRDLRLRAEMRNGGIPIDWALNVDQLDPMLDPAKGNLARLLEYSKSLTISCCHGSARLPRVP